MESLDLQSPDAPGTINGWVKKNTNEKIEEIVKEIDPDAILFLINAIYFKGDWTEPFEEKATKNGDFITTGGDKVQVPMMSRGGEFEYKKADGYEAVRLPYGKKGMRMVIYVPFDVSGLSRMTSALLTDHDQLTVGFSMMEGHLSMPRFKLEYNIELKDALKALGMGAAFEPSTANFENMAPIPPVISISRVLHKTFVEVNEKGTEAAAVTAVEAVATSAPTDFFQLEVNRPFFFTIEEDTTGALLFLGSVTDPS